MAAPQDPSQIEQQSLSNNTYVVAPTQGTDTNTEPLDAQTKQKLIIIAIVAVVIIIIVSILAVVIGSNEAADANVRPSWPQGPCGCNLRVDSYFDYYYNRKIDAIVCGKSAYNGSNSTVALTNISANECPINCNASYGYDTLQAMYYVHNTSSCYCYTQRQRYLVAINRSLHYDSYCFNASGFNVTKWVYECCEYGRSYSLDSMQLHSDITSINCDDYRYYDDNEWKHFITSSNYSGDNMQMIAKWTKQATSEYASIAAFAKFSLQLMSIRAPLWFVELSNKAALDEIKHAQISFDILNMYLNGEECISANAFPPHIVDIDANWNNIATDTAIGGCIGESLSAFRMMDNMHYSNMMDVYLYEMALDEIRHAALAWITVKWMLDNAPVDIDIADEYWWHVNIQNAMLDDEEAHVFASILGKMKTDCENYHDLYDFIVDALQQQLNRANCYGS